MPTTSGTYNFNLNNSDVVLEALDRIQVRGPAVTSSHMVSANRSLNLALQTWSNRGVNLWAVDLQTIDLVAGQKTYDIPPETIDILDVYYVQPVSTAPSINRILEPISRTDYAAYSNPDLQGIVTTYWFDRTNSPTITFYQVPAQGSPYTVNYYRLRRMQDASIAAGQLPDVNYRFLEALCADMAARLAEKYNPGLEQGMRLKAKMTWDEAWAEDREKVPVFITPALERYWDN